MSIALYFLREYILYINVLFILIIILIEKRNPLYTLFWIMILILAPYFGFVLYLFLGLKFQKRRRAEKYYKWKFSHSRDIIGAADRADLNKWRQLISYLDISSKSKLTTSNAVEIFTLGRKFFDRMKADIENAQKSVNLEYYLFRYDGLGREMAELLIRKVKSGVNVKIIIDGASSVDKSMLKSLSEAGCQVRRFFPWHFLFLKIASLRVNYRDHRKLTIIDDKIGYIGGFNIGDEYLGKGELGNWRDTAVRIHGDCVLELQKEFYFSWGIVNDKDDFDLLELPYRTDSRDVLSPEQLVDATYMQVVSSGPNYQYRTMRDNFLKIILEAQRYIYVQTPYFVPDEIILEALKVAATSGVKIKIMIPEKCDHIFMKWVNQYFAGELIDLGVKIYRYRNGFLHSKLVLADDEVASVGSANFDYRSLYQNFEINVNIYDTAMVREFARIFRDDARLSDQIFTKQFKNRGILAKCAEAVFRLLAPIL